MSRTKDAVDLDQVEGDALEVVERPEAGAVIVDRDLAAELGEPIREPSGRFVVVDGGGLGQLERAARRVGPAFVQAALDELEHRDVRQRSAGEVDVQRDRPADPLPLGEQLQRAADNPAIELLDHARALGRIDEGRRRQQLPSLAAHPQQQLVALYAAGSEAANRLGVKLKTVLRERIADSGGCGLVPLGLLPLLCCGFSGR